MTHLSIFSAFFLFRFLPLLCIPSFKVALAKKNLPQKIRVRVLCSCPYPPINTARQIQINCSTTDKIFAGGELATENLIISSSSRRMFYRTKYNFWLERSRYFFFSSTSCFTRTDTLNSNKSLHQLKNKSVQLY